jgi:hypothetical protein
MINVRLVAAASIHCGENPLRREARKKVSFADTAPPGRNARAFQRKRSEYNVAIDGEGISYW